MPVLTIIESTGKKDVVNAYTVLKDGRPFAYCPNITAARAIKVACEDWWLRSKRKMEE
jgi:hypothetical protein